MASDQTNDAGEKHGWVRSEAKSETPTGCVAIDRDKIMSLQLPSCEEGHSNPSKFFLDFEVALVKLPEAFWSADMLERIARDLRHLEHLHNEEGSL